MEPSLTAARTPRHDLPYLYPGQTQKEAFVNEALARLDCAAQCSVRGTETTPPLAPSDGETWLIGDGAQGEWAGRDGRIALWAGNQWLYQPPREGMWLFDADRQAFARIDASGDALRAIAPALPAGGTVVDLEARAALGEVVANLRHLGIFG